MANMAYCRWENTSKDMQDCLNSLQDIENIGEWFANLDRYEQEGVREVLRCAEALVEFKDELVEDL